MKLINKNEFYIYFYYMILMKYNYIRLYINEDIIN